MRRSLFLFFLMVAPVPDAQANAPADFQEKCRVELENDFVPRHCFLWIRAASLTHEKKAYLLQWFNAACERSVQKNTATVEFHIRTLPDLSVPCREAVSEGFKEWSYKARAETPERVLSLFSKAGKDIEYTSGDGMAEKKTEQKSSD